MTNLESEVSLLRYKIELLAYFVNDDSPYPFFQFCLNNDITKNQEQALIKVLGIYNYRYKKVKNELHEQGISDKSLRELLSPFNLKPEDLYVESVPTYSEFQNVVSSIFGEKVRVHALLGKLKKQSIHEELCEYLLSSK